jgi:hypothetical protein
MARFRPDSRPSKGQDLPLVLAGRILFVYFGWKSDLEIVRDLRR